MRNIDGDALIEFIKSLPKEQNGTSRAYDEAFMIQMLENADTIKQQNWISVNEKLPNLGIDVLICSNKGYIEIGNIDLIDEKHLVWFTSSWRFGEVVAWMPLPEPYKAESEG